MELIRAGATTRAITAFESDAFELTRLVDARGEAVVHLASLGPGGRIGRHPAATAQLLAVVSGRGAVSGADGREVTVGPGDAVLWGAGELHETRSDEGLVAVIVEGRELEPRVSA